MDARAIRDDRGERELLAWIPKLEQLPSDALRPVHADPYTSAVTGLLVADFVAQPEISRKLHALAIASAFRRGAVEELQALSRVILTLLERLGGGYLPASNDTSQRIPSRLVQKGEALRATMLESLEHALPGSAEVRLWLDAIRRATDDADLVFDLRTLAELYADHRQALERARPQDAVADDERAARRTADGIERALWDGHSEDEQRHRSLLLRAWSQFVVSYEEVCNAGRFVMRGKRDERHFPPLAMIAAHRRAKRRPMSIVPPRTPPIELTRSALEAREGIVSVTPSTAMTSAPPLPRADAPPSPQASGYRRAFRNEGTRPPASPPEPATPAVILQPTGSSAPPLAEVAQPKPHVPVQEVLRAAAAPVEPSADARATVETRANATPSRELPAEAATPVETPADPATSLETPAADAPTSVEMPADGATTLETPADARHAERHHVQIEVGIFSESNFYIGFTENLSEGGVFIATYRARPIGSKLTLELHTPEGELEVRGVVRWLRTLSCEGWPGMGVQFEGLRPEDEAVIRSFLTFRQPLFFAD
jgi:uncharacterized protein (TIGR02266 family)